MVGCGCQISKESKKKTMEPNVRHRELINTIVSPCIGGATEGGVGFES